MKLTTRAATALFILICFGIAQSITAQSPSTKSRHNQRKPAQRNQVNQPPGSTPKPDRYCPTPKERGGLCGAKELRAGRCNALMVAAEAGDLNAVRGLLEKHSDVNAQGPARHTALTLAALAGHLDVVKALLGAGANPNTLLIGRYASVGIALAMAMNRCNEDWLQIMDAMIAAGAEVNPKGPWGPLPLMYAIEKQDLVIIKALLARGADVNLKDAVGYTPLMMATLSSTPSVAVVKLLLSAGADPKAKNNEGDTALSLLYKYAQDRKERNEIARLLKQERP